MVEDNFTDDLNTATEADVDECYGSKYFSATDLGNKRIRTRIAKVRKEKLRQQDGTDKPKLVIYFTTLDKPMVVNATNKNTLVEALGRDPAKWIGVEVGLLAELTQFAGKPVRGLRLRVLGPITGKAAPVKPPPKPIKPAVATEPPPDDPNDPGAFPDANADFTEAAE